MREALENVDINLGNNESIHFIKGERLVCYSAHGHHNEVFFPQANVFKFDRFIKKSLDNENISLNNSNVKESCENNLQFILTLSISF